MSFPVRGREGQSSLGEREEGGKSEPLQYAFNCSYFSGKSHTRILHAPKPGQHLFVVVLYEPRRQVETYGGEEREERDGGGRKGEQHTS